MKPYISLALAVAAAGAAAESPPMEHVLVSVPLHKKTAETALPVTVLTGDDLRRAAASTIGDTLNSTPGLANASFGPGVGRPVIRGQQGARVKVLQNGTSSADASNLSADHAVSVEPMLADSIEVLRGPATLLYGGGAIGGVINVIDNRIPVAVPGETSGGVEYRHDSASDMDSGVLRLDGGEGSFAYHLDGLYREWNNLDIPGRAANEADVETTDGYIANTGGRTKSATGGGSYHFDDGFFGLAVNRLENNYGIPAGAHGEHEDEDDHEEEGGAHEEEGDVTIDVAQTRYDAALHLHNVLPLTEVLRGFLTYTDYGHKEIEAGGEVGTRYSNKTWEGRLELVHQPLGDFHGVMGLQVRSGEFSALGEEAFIPRTDNTDIGLFLVEDWHSGAWTFEGGLRLDWVERDPSTSAAAKQDFNSLSLSGSALWDFAEQWQTGLALSRAERAPTDEELYSNIEAAGPQDWVVHAATNAIELGDPGLDTEVSNSVDVFLRWTPAAHFIELSLFYNDFDDYINLANTGQEVNEVPVYAYGHDDARLYGVEFDSDFVLLSRMGGELSLRLFGDAIYGELDKGGDVPRLPPARLGSRLDWSAQSWEIWTSVIHAADQDKPGDFESTSQGYTRWDLGGEYRVPINAAELTAFLEFRNIGDEQIRLSTSFLREVAPEAGRSVQAGIRYSF